MTPAPQLTGWAASAAAVAARRTSLTGRPRLAGERGDVLVLDADVDHPAAVGRRPSRPPGRRAPRPTTSSGPAPPCPPARPAARSSTSSRTPPPARRGTVSGRHSADSVCAGRPFFIRIGVSQASEAPAANSASRTPGHSRGSRSSTLASSTTGAGAAPASSARPAPAGRRWAAAPGRGRRRPCRPARPASAAAASTRRPRGHAGPRRWACTSRSATGPAITGASRPAAPAPPGRGSGRRRARRGPSRCPARPGRR